MIGVWVNSISSWGFVLKVYQDTVLMTGNYCTYPGSEVSMSLSLEVCVLLNKEKFIGFRVVYDISATMPNLC